MYEFRSHYVVIGYTAHRPIVGSVLVDMQYHTPGSREFALLFDFTTHRSIDILDLLHAYAM